ncbi:hypothetical protein MYU51_004431 [Penicillium brevicompactum]|uniref:uncharacterized protein n=1 Tax=Penicillium brevicompactum TaxID=5074 RepID=UPI002541D1EE|nr:uncharacterized protein N7506_000468 [Penicillium brevicompactum]KAJ5347215.1 hypothetical protein N7506_000468 [Penicillium brevicompactum]
MQTLPRGAPAFLSNCAAYRRYIQDVANGSLALPPFQQNADGATIIAFGEVYCRLPDCEHRKRAFSAINNLRAHVERHGVAVAPTASGRITQAQMDAVMEFYKKLFEDSDSSEEVEDEAEDDEEEEEIKDEDEDQ